MIEVSKDEINRLIRKYLEDEGYFYTLYTFKNEAAPSDRPLTHALVPLINKGMQYLYGHRHLHGDKVVACGSRFSLSEEHVCDQPQSPEKIEAVVQTLSEAKTGVLACWGGESLAVYASSELLAFQTGSFLWKKALGGLTALSWTNEDVVAGNRDGEVITINTLSGRMRNYVCHRGMTTRVQQRGRGILSAGSDGRIVVMNNGIKELSVSTAGIADCVWMTDTDVGCALDDFSVALANAESGAVSRFEGHSGRITAIGHRESVMSTSSHDCTLGLWNTATMDTIRIAHADEVNGHRWMDDRVASCCADGLVSIWDVEKRMSLFSIRHADSALAIDCSSRLIASGSADGVVIISDSRCREVWKTRVSAAVSALLFSQSGTSLCICTSESAPVLVNLRHT